MLPKTSLLVNARHEQIPDTFKDELVSPSGIFNVNDSPNTRAAIVAAAAGARTFAAAVSARGCPHGRMRFAEVDEGTTLRVVAPLPEHMAESWESLGFDEGEGETALAALLTYAEGIRHSPGRGSQER